MRIFLPLDPEDRDQLADSARRLELRSGRAAWAATDQARADRPEQDDEEHEYDALQDAVHVALGAVGPTQRALVIAADVPDAALTAGRDEQGAYGAQILSDTAAAIASFHVTELDARSAEADDTDPAVLWFDATEGPDALAYLDGAAAGGQPVAESR